MNSFIKKQILLLFILCLNLGLSAQNPMLRVIDTDFSKGRLLHLDTLYLTDAVKFHGHLCDGLALGFVAMQEMINTAYPDGVCDRTNNRMVSRSSPCLTDIAIYLSGGRYQYGSFDVSDSIPYLFILQRKDNAKTFGIKLKPGIKPAVIDSLGALANKGLLAACELDHLKQLEDDFTKMILSARPADLFILEAIANFSWNPVLSKQFVKTDILNKSVKNCKD